MTEEDRPNFLRDNWGHIIAAVLILGYFNARVYFTLEGHPEQDAVIGYTSLLTTFAFFVGGIFTVRWLKPHIDDAVNNLERVLHDVSDKEDK